MEIPRTSSIAQATAYFTGYSEDEQRQQILNLFPDAGPNVLIESLDRSQAISESGEITDFLIKDRIEGHRMLQGPLAYPFHSTAEIFNHKFDPLYFDGSEDAPNFNVQENLIGRPLGAEPLQDHRLAYVDNLLKLKEYQSSNSALDDDYIKQLYLTNTEKGAQYYFNQLQDLRESMGLHARNNAERNSLPLSEVHFTSKIQRGVGEHPKALRRRVIPQPSTSMNIQSNHRRDQMRVVEKQFLTPKVEQLIDPQIDKEREPDDLTSIATGSKPDNDKGGGSVSLTGKTPSKNKARDVIQFASSGALAASGVASYFTGSEPTDPLLLAGYIAAAAVATPGTVNAVADAYTTYFNTQPSSSGEMDANAVWRKEARRKKQKDIDAGLLKYTWGDRAEGYTEPPVNIAKRAWETLQEKPTKISIVKESVNQLKNAKGISFESPSQKPTLKPTRP